MLSGVRVPSRSSAKPQLRGQRSTNLAGVDKPHANGQQSKPAVHSQRVADVRMGRRVNGPAVQSLDGDSHNATCDGRPESSQAKSSPSQVQCRPVSSSFFQFS